MKYNKLISKKSLINLDGDIKFCIIYSPLT